ncbi:hypothetical protein LCGC14_2010200, partial [marine sediment metagenome]
HYQAVPHVLRKIGKILYISFRQLLNNWSHNIGPGICGHSMAYHNADTAPILPASYPIFVAFSLSYHTPP